jgi:hypothetical protein
MAGRQGGRFSPGRVGIVTIALICLPVAGAVAQGLIGDWAGAGEGQVEATIRPDPSRSGNFLAEVTTQSGACGGGVEVSGRLGDVAVASGEDPGIGVCRIEFKLVGLDRVRVSEVDGCLPYHGASCGFSGELARVGTAPAAAPRTAERPPAPAGGRGGPYPGRQVASFSSSMRSTRPSR